MKKIVILLILIASIALTGHGFENESSYNVANIPEELKEDAVAVLRNHEVIFEIQSESKAKKRTLYAVTILDENGDRFATFNEWYDKYVSISNIKIVIYDQDGGIIEKVKQSEIRDFSSFSDFSIYEDNRQKVYVPNVKSYPYTIEIGFEQDYNGLFIYPVWRAVEGFDISIQKSSFKVISPSWLEYRIHEENLLDDAVIFNGSDRTIVEWSLENYPAVEWEQNSPYLFEYTPIVYTAPKYFEIEGYKGNMETWDSLGVWAYKLLEGRSNISEETGNKIRNIVIEAKDKREMARLVYEYVQSNTRYVSIQEGIGGWQPMPAIQVDQLGYGDCKALSNFTRSLLSEVGIESYYTKVRAGRNVPDMMEYFVSNQSNHIILCVPIDNDTIWLECTSQISPFGYIGNFTDDRNVLVLTPEGGKLVRTRKYIASENRQITNATVDLRNVAQAKVDVSCSYSGLQYDNVSSLLRKSNADREKWLLTNLGVETFKINSFQIEQVPGKDVVPEIVTTLDIDISNYASGRGDRLFIPLNLLNVTDYIPPRYRDRKRDLVLTYQFTDIDSIRYTLPEGYEIESCPADCNILTEFGEFTVNITVENNKVLYVRKRVMYEGEHPSSSYTVFRQFYTDMSKADGAKLVLKAGG